MNASLKRAIFIGFVVAAALLASAAPTAAAGNGNGNGGLGNGNGNGNKSPSVNATPELDSIVLFGLGAAGMAGYAVNRMRVGLRRGKDRDN